MEFITSTLKSFLAKSGLIVLCVIGGVVVVAIIVAMIAYGLHKRKKKSRVGSLSNGELNKMFF